VFDRVRDVHLGPIDPGAFERSIEQSACRTDEGATLHVLPISGLFADQHHLGGRRSLAEHGLRGIEIQVTTLTARGSGPQ
jgi:hypothetical protein